jgi:RND family efflux transporter MFP subunit
MNEIYQAKEFEDGQEPVGAHARLPIVLPKPPGKTRRLLKRWLVGSAALLPLVAGVAFGAFQFEGRNHEALAATEATENFVPAVQVATIQPSDSTEIVSLPATTLAFEAANIFARANGYIETRKVDIGDHVKKGDLLAQITAPELDHQIAQNEATLRQDQATLQQAMASRDLAGVTNLRDSDLVKKGWLTAQQGDTDRLTLDAQNAAVAVAQSNIAAQQALLKVLDQQKSYQSVVAPFDGVITQRNVDVGSLVQAGTTFMFTLMQSDVIRTQVFVPQDAAFGVSPGVAATVRVPEIPGRSFSGKVTRLADALAPGTRTLLTEIDVPNPDGLLRPGMYCTVELHIPRKTPSLTVPADAIVFNDDGVRVAVVKDGVAHFHKVTIARDLGTQVEVRDGVKPGDRVVLRPNVELADGAKVQVHAPAIEVSEK